MRKSLRLSLILSLFFCSSQIVQAQLWDGGGDGTSWNDPLNWVGDVEPVLGAFVDFNSSVTLTLAGTGTAAAPPAQVRVRGASTVVNLDFDLDIGDPVSTSPAVQLNNGGTLTILAGRTLILDPSTTENAVQINAAASCVVQEGGSLLVLKANRGINLAGAMATFTNDGVVSLNGCVDHGIYLLPNSGLLNSGQIDIESPGRNGIQNLGGFVNVGNLTINTPTARGIRNVQATAPNVSTFVNAGSGTILITSAGTDGIRSESAFLNDTGAKITVQEATDEGIELPEDVFTNNGSIDIQCRPGAGLTGPGLSIGTSSSVATFINTSNNSLSINAGASFNGRSIFISTMGNLQNTGTIRSSGSAPNLNILNRGTFSNGIGATINLNNVHITNAGSFTNNGLISSSYTGGPGVFTTGIGTSSNTAFYQYPVISNFSNGGGAINNTGTDLMDPAQYTIDFAGSCAGIMQVTSIYDWVSGANTVGSNDILGNIVALPGSINGSLTISPSVFPAVIFDVVNVCAASLPIDLLSFTAEPNDKTVMLKWQTASEINNDYMAVERSIDGRTFREIGRLAGALESVEIKNYQLEDPRPQPGDNYYRLRQVDIDGTTTYSNIISVSFKGGQTEIATPKMYPNVVYNGQSVQMDLQSFPVGSSVDLVVIDLHGRSWPLKSLDGGSSTQLLLPSLPAGTYILQATNQSNSQIYRFVVVD